MRPLPWMVIVGLTACGGSSHVPPRPLGVTDNLLEAEQREAEADRREAEANELASVHGVGAVCGDVVIADQPQSGTEPILLAPPCWSGESDVVARNLDEANRLRADARAHRQRARELLAAEQASCAQMPEDELSHTPFAHRDDVAAVTALLEADRVRGARIQFEPVDGLTASWLRTALACHHARAAALGYDADYMGYDPSVLAGAVSEVIDDATGLTVVIRAADDITALAIYGRAEDLLDEER